MILQKIRGFFEWLGKRSMAKSRKALNYEWTTMRPEGEAPVKTVNIDEPPASERPVPVKVVDVPATKSDAAVSAPTPAEPDVEKQKAAILKEFTVSAAIQLLQGKFEKAADVRRSRMALFTFLKDNPEAVAFLQEQAKQKKAAKKTARRTAIKQAAAESSAEGKTEKPVAKKPAAKKAAPKKSATKPIESKEVVQSAVEKLVDANQKTEEPAPAVKPAPRKTTVKRTAAKKTVSAAETQQAASAKKPAVKKPAARKTAVKKPAVRKAAPKAAEESKPAEPAPDAEKTSA